MAHRTLTNAKFKEEKQETFFLSFKDSIQLFTPILPPDPSCIMDENHKSSITTMSSCKKGHLSPN